MRRLRSSLVFGLSLLLLLSLLPSLQGCATGPKSLTPKQRLIVLNDSVSVAETAITAAVRAGAISPAENTKLIRPAMLTIRSALERAGVALSKTPPDSMWQQLLDDAEASLPVILNYAKIGQTRQQLPQSQP